MRKTFCSLLNVYKKQTFMRIYNSQANKTQTEVFKFKFLILLFPRFMVFIA